MPKVNFKTPHDKSMKELKEKIELFSDKYQAKREWKKENECHFSGDVSGIPFSGVIKLYPQEVRVVLNLPMAVLPFKSQIINAVIKEVNN